MAVAKVKILRCDALDSLAGPYSRVSAFTSDLKSARMALLVFNI